MKQRKIWCLIICTAALTFWSHVAQATDEWDVYQTFARALNNARNLGGRGTNGDHVSVNLARENPEGYLGCDGHIERLTLGRLFRRACWGNPCFTIHFAVNCSPACSTTPEPGRCLSFTDTCTVAVRSNALTILGCGTIPVRGAYPIISASSSGNAVSPQQNADTSGPRVTNRSSAVPVERQKTNQDGAAAR